MFPTQDFEILTINQEDFIQLSNDENYLLEFHQSYSDPLVSNQSNPSIVPSNFEENCRLLQMELEDVDEYFDNNNNNNNNNRCLLNIESCNEQVEPYNEQEINDLIGPLTPPKILSPTAIIPEIEIRTEFPNSNFGALLAQIHLLTQQKDFFYLHLNKSVTVDTLVKVKDALFTLQKGEPLSRKSRLKLQYNYPDFINNVLYTFSKDELENSKEITINEEIEPIIVKRKKFENSKIPVCHKTKPIIEFLVKDSPVLEKCSMAFIGTKQLVELPHQLRHICLNLSIPKNEKRDVKIKYRKISEVTYEHLTNTNLYIALKRRLNMINDNLKTIYLEVPMCNNYNEYILIACIIRLFNQSYPHIIGIFPIIQGFHKMTQKWLTQFKHSWIENARLINIVFQVIGVAIYIQYDWNLPYDGTHSFSRKLCTGSNNTSDFLYTKDGLSTNEFGARLFNKLKKLNNLLYPYRIR
jgi:hypothetical protein